MIAWERHFFDCLFDNMSSDLLQFIWEFLAGAGWLLSFLFAVQVVRRRGSPSATLAWILAFFLLPLIGPVLYLLSGDTRVIRRSLRRQQKRGGLSALLYINRNQLLARLPAYRPDSLGGIVSGVALRVSGAAPVSVPQIEAIHRGEEFFERLCSDIAQAQSYVLLEFYRFFSDTTGHLVGEALKAAASRGVQALVLYDDIGSYSLSHRFMSDLGKYGVRFASFENQHWFRRKMHVNFRNHRKIVIIDGHCAYTGGMNVADETRGRWLAKAETDWRDTQLRIIGNAARLYEQVFREDWTFSTGTMPDLPDVPLAPERSTGGTGIQIISGGPGDDIEGFHAILITLLGNARRTVRIGTPYLIPDETVENLLLNARARGVVVEIIVPRSGNHPLVELAGKSYYRRLFDAGVRIHEYLDGMYHAKIMTVDDEVAVVGSSNIDQRSFRLNFEINTLINSHSFTAELNATMDHDISLSQPLTAEWFARRTRWSVLASDLCRIAAPLL